MRFPFPPAPATSVISSEPPSLELNIPIDEFTDATAIEFGSETCSIAVAAEDSPQLTTEFIPAADAPEITAASVAVEKAPAAAPESNAVAAEAPVEAVPPQLPDAEPAPTPIVHTRPRPKRKVIAFPRQPGASETIHRLADPVLPEQPRILDVPEELEAYPSTPFLDGLQFEPTAAVPAAPLDHVELPFRATGTLQRIYASLIDCSVVAVAAALFAVIGHKMLPDLAFTKPVRLTAALVPLLLWAIYQYLLLVYAGRTAGMQVAGIRVSTFKGRPPSLRDRRHRVLGLYLSTASLLMGLLWALVDIDALCWHDRISGTYLTRRE